MNTQELNQEVKSLEKSFDDIEDLDPSLKKSLFRKYGMDSRCPRKLKTLPTSHCTYALNTINEVEDTNKNCEWFIIHEPSNYCFWAFMAVFYNSIDHTLKKIAEHTGSTITAVDLLQRKALAKLQKRFGTQFTFMNSNIDATQKNKIYKNNLVSF